MSKKDSIIELMDKGKSAKQVADMLGTSESYVNKIKSISRRESAISSSAKYVGKSIPISSDVEFTNTQPKMPKNDQALSITPETRRSFYECLEMNKTPVDFIKQTGVDGRQLEKEYEIYLRFKGADPRELQKELLALVGYEESQIKSIISAAPSNLLTNSTLLVQLKKGIDQRKGWWCESMMIQYSINKDCNLPLKFKRPICSKCGNEVMGVLVIKRYMNILDHLNSVSLCASCRGMKESDS
jgi:hypothetical protein